MDDEMVTCEVCGEEIPIEEAHLCKDCLSYFCPDCWEEEAYKPYGLCGACGDKAAREIYWDGKLLEEKEEGRNWK